VDAYTSVLGCKINEYIAPSLVSLVTTLMKILNMFSLTVLLLCRSGLGPSFGTLCTMLALKLQVSLTLFSN